MVVTKKTNNFTTFKSNNNKKINPTKKKLNVTKFKPNTKTKKKNYKPVNLNNKLKKYKTKKTISGGFVLFTDKKLKQLRNIMKELYDKIIKKYHAKLINTNHKKFKNIQKQTNIRVNKFIKKLLFKRLINIYKTNNFKLKLNNQITTESNNNKELSFFDILINTNNLNIINNFLIDTDNILKEFILQEIKNNKEPLFLSEEDIKKDLENKPNGLFRYETKHTLLGSSSKNNTNSKLILNKLYIVIKKDNNVLILPYILNIINYYINQINSLAKPYDNKLIKQYYLKLKNESYELNINNYSYKFSNFIIAYIKFKYNLDIN